MQDRCLMWMHTTNACSFRHHHDQHLAQTWPAHAALIMTPYTGKICGECTADNAHAPACSLKSHQGVQPACRMWVGSGRDPQWSACQYEEPSCRPTGWAEGHSCQMEHLSHWQGEILLYWLCLWHAQQVGSQHLYLKISEAWHVIVHMTS